MRLKLNRVCAPGREWDGREGQRAAPIAKLGRLILVRHGESEGNRDRRFSISSEVELTEIGRQQAHEVAQRIKTRFQPRKLIILEFVSASSADQRDNRR